MTISSEIINVLDALCEKFGIAIDWTQQNIIPYLQEIAAKVVAYEVWTSVAWIGIFLIPIIIFLAMFIGIQKNGIEKVLGEKCHEDVTFNSIIYVISIICTIIGICVIVCQVFDIITCLTFPEKVILDFVKSSNLLPQ